MRQLAICVLVSSLAFCSQANGQGGIISTVAGGGPAFTFPANVNVALNAPLGSVSGVAVDSQGNIYVADPSNNRIFLVSSGGSLRIVGGNGSYGFSGDGGLATSAELNYPSGVAVDASGNLFVADTYNNRIRKVSAGGIIETVAGGGAPRDGLGDGGPATSASLFDPGAVAADASGNLFVADTYNNRIRKVSASGIITTIAGSGPAYPGGGFAGDGGPATSAEFSYPSGIAVDASGNLFISDANNNRIRKVSSSGIVTTVAGNGTTNPRTGLSGFSGDGGPATSAQLNNPTGVAVDAAGNLFIADSFNNRIRKVSPNGTITTVVGDFNYGFSGDGGLATSASLSSPSGVAVNASGNVFIADTGNLRIREASANGLITTVAGNGNYGISGDGGPATSATLNFPGSVVVDPSGSLFIADIDNNRIRKVSASGVITTVAGNGTSGSSGDGGLATSASLNLNEDANGTVASVAVDAGGNLFIPDNFNNRIRKVSASGLITTVAGNGTLGFSGDGGPATSAELFNPHGVAVDASGNLFIADTDNSVIRKVSVSGIITTIAGNGSGGFSGDGGPATSAELSVPFGVVVDASGNLFIADTGNDRVRKLSASGIIETVAGGGNPSDGLGDGGPATSAEFYNPLSVAVDAAGNLFIADDAIGSIRKVSPGGTITTVAGNATGAQISGGFSGDGGPAALASLNGPSGVAVDGAGNLFIADTLNNRIRKVSTPASSTTQTITFGALSNVSIGVAPFMITATANSGLVVRFASTTPTVCTVAGTTVTIVSGGTCSITATQPGNATFSAATPVIQSFTVFTAPEPPSITSGGIVAVDSTVATIQAGEFVSIYGTNLGPAPPATWTGVFVTSLGGTSVTIDGNAAYLTYASPTQINLQAPNNTNTTTRSVPVVVTTGAGTATSTVTLAQFAPSFLLFDSKHVTGIILRPDGSGSQGGGTYDLLGPTGNSLGFPTVAAKAGDSVQLYAVGLGPTNPPVQAGQAFSGAAPATNLVNLLINSVSVLPSFAGLDSSLLYQINLTVPAGLGTGDVPLVATVGGVQTQSGVVISLQ